MNNYLHNLKLWALGWGRFGEVDFKAGWSANSVGWWLLYGFDYGACVLFLAGPVESVSAFMQRHRSGLINDKVLDIIEVFDARHGRNAGPPLFGSVESSLRVRIVAPICWALVALIAWSI